MVLVSIQEIRALIGGIVNYLGRWLRPELEILPIQINPIADLAIPPIQGLQAMHIEQPHIDPALLQLMQPEELDKDGPLRKLANNPDLQALLNLKVPPVDLWRHLSTAPTTYYATEQEGVFTEGPSCSAHHFNTSI